MIATFNKVIFNINAGGSLKILKPVTRNKQDPEEFTWKQAYITALTFTYLTVWY